MTHRSPSRLAPLLVLLQISTGCSFAFMTKPPEVVAAPSYPVECTSSRAAPVLDTICAGYFIANTLVLAGATTCDTAGFGQSCVESTTKSTGIALSVGLAALCGISAASGYGVATRCEAVKSTNALCIVGDEAACRQLNSKWTPPMRFPATPAAPAAGVAPDAGAAPETAGCTKDTDCKGDRVCNQGRCAEAAPRAAPGGT